MERRGRWAPLRVGNTTGYSAAFNGNGIAIRNLYINRGGDDFVGLFGRIDAGAVIENVALVNVAVTGRDRVGGLTGFAAGGSVTASYVTGSVSGRRYPGGLVGNNQGAISDSYSMAAVSGGWAGGLTSSHGVGSVTNSYAIGAVSGGNAGGLIARASGGNVATGSYWDTETSLAVQPQSM